MTGAELHKAAERSILLQWLPVLTVLGAIVTVVGVLLILNGNSFGSVALSIGLGLLGLCYLLWVAGTIEKRLILIHRALLVKNVEPGAR